jgi:hypothetical protein
LQLLPNSISVTWLFAGFIVFLKVQTQSYRCGNEFLSARPSEEIDLKYFLDSILVSIVAYDVE